MDNQYFGTDGIRNKVGIYPITPSFFLKLGQALGSVLMKEKGSATVIIGKDTRISGYMLESALEAGILASGANVILVGPMPTPAIAYLTKAYSATVGAVISASHNSYVDNGIKFFCNNGFKLSDDYQNKIIKKLNANNISMATKIGKARRADQAVGRYIEFCKGTFDKSLHLKNLTIVIDCANGATYHIAPFVFKELGAKVISINDNPDGLNINKDCGATDTKHLQDIVKKENANLGIALDGDGDRLIMTDSNSNIVDGDLILFIIAKYLHGQGKLKNNAVVGTKMTNMGVIKALNNEGIDFYESDIGDRFVIKEMQKHKLILGGEGSGHIICFQHTTSGDGIIAALQVLSAIVANNTSLDKLVANIPKYQQCLLNIVSNSTMDDIKNNPKLQQEITNINNKLAGNGKILIRRSGTENLIRVMVEGRDINFVKQSANNIAKFIK